MNRYLKAKDYLDRNDPNKIMHKVEQDPEMLKLTNIISWAAAIETSDKDVAMPLNDHITLVNEIANFAERIRPLYEKYGGK